MTAILPKASKRSDFMNEVLRVEQKYLVDYIAYRQSFHHFSALLTPDRHNGENGYLIRSLYFDTPDNCDYVEKESGVEIRKKIRLRIYAPDAPSALLEMKQKQGVSQKKRSLAVSRKVAQQLIAGNYSALLAMDNAFARECFVVLSTGLYRPKAVVEYYRQAFVTHEANTRVTFDSNLRACEMNYDLFSQHLPLTPILNPALVVLEVKYNGFLLSYVQDTINRINKSALSVSKYCAGRTLLQ